MFLELRQWAVSLGLTVVLASACAAPSQRARLGLSLSPGALGTSISVQQHLIIEREEHVADFDVALEIDEDEINMVGMALGRRVLTLHFDGKRLDIWRDPMVPPQLRGEDVLEDLQLTLWPIETIREALPNGWQIEENDRRRGLFWNGNLVTLIYYSDKPRWSGEVVILNFLYHYKLTIVTALQDASQ
jgi:hypothetical protein